MIPAKTLRRMYRGERPSRLAAVLNRVSARTASAGLPPRRMVTLEVPSRRTGKPITLPLVIADYNGDRYLVSMLGERANWVRNVRATGGRAVLHHGHAQPVLLTEVAAAERAPILRRYLALAPGARAHIRVDRREPVQAFESIADRYPVFRVTPR